MTQGRVGTTKRERKKASSVWKYKAIKKIRVYLKTYEEEIAIPDNNGETKHRENKSVQIKWICSYLFLFHGTSMCAMLTCYKSQPYVRFTGGLHLLYSLMLVVYTIP